jgi:hypothetical protein
VPRIAAAALVVALAAAFAAAAAFAITPVDPAVPDPRITDGSAQRALDGARERWRALGARSYRMRVRLQCFCPHEITRPRTLTVRRGKPVGPVPSHLRPYATVPRLLATVQRAIDEKVAGLTAEYNRHGIPTTIFIDRSFRIADEEHGIGADRFRMIRSGG